MYVTRHFTQYTLASLLLASVLFSSCGSEESEDPVVTDTDSFALKIGSSEDETTKSYMDGDGNIIMAGSFNGTLTIGDQQLISAGNTDIFIAKYKSTGDLIWAKRAGGTGMNFVVGLSADALGNVYITGQLSGASTFDNTTIAPISEYNDLYIAKYTSAGNLAWIKQVGGVASKTGAVGTSVTTDASGNVYLTGTFYGEVFFENIILRSAGSNDIFVAKYNGNGNVIWARKAGGTQSDYGIDVTADASGNVYVCGTFQGTTDFAEVPLVSTGMTDLFIARYNSSGDLQWVKKAGGIQSDYVQDMTKDASDNIFVTGSFQKTANFSGTELTGSEASDDAYTAKYNSSGELIWVKNLKGASGHEGGLSVFADASGQAYVTGIFSSNSASDGINTITGAGDSDIFITKYSSAGDPLWLKSAGLSTEEIVTGISVNATGHVYVTGMFTGTTKLGDTDLVSAGKKDVFLWKFKP